MKIVLDTNDQSFYEFAYEKLCAIISRNSSQSEQYLFIDLKSYAGQLVPVLESWNQKLADTAARIFILVRSQDEVASCARLNLLFDHCVLRDRLIETMETYFNGDETSLAGRVKIAVPFKVHGAYASGVFARSPIALAPQSKGEFFFPSVLTTFILESEECIENPLEEKTFETSLKLSQPDQTTFKEFSKWFQSAVKSVEAGGAVLLPKKIKADSKFRVAMIWSDSHARQRFSEAAQSYFAQCKMDLFSNAENFLLSLRSIVQVEAPLFKKSEYFSVDNQTDVLRLYLNSQHEIQKVLVNHTYRTINGVPIADIENGKMNFFEFFMSEDVSRVREILFFLTAKNAITQFFQIRNGSHRQLCEMKFSKKNRNGEEFVEIEVAPNPSGELSNNRMYEDVQYDLIILENSDDSTVETEYQALLDGLQTLMKDRKYQYTFPEVWHFGARRQKTQRPFYVLPLAVPILLQDMYLNFGAKQRVETGSIPTAEVSETIFALSAFHGSMTGVSVRIKSATPLSVGRLISFYFDDGKKRAVPYKIRNCQSEGDGFLLTAERVDLT